MFKQFLNELPQHHDFLHIQGPRGLLGPRGSAGPSGQRVCTSPISLNAYNTHNIHSSSMKLQLSLWNFDPCRVFLDLMGKLVLKETW